MLAKVLESNYWVFSGIAEYIYYYITCLDCTCCLFILSVVIALIYTFQIMIYFNYASKSVLLNLNPTAKTKTILLPLPLYLNLQIFLLNCLLSIIY